MSRMLAALRQIEKRTGGNLADPTLAARQTESDEPVSVAEMTARGSPASTRCDHRTGSNFHGRTSSQKIGRTYRQEPESSCTSDDQQAPRKLCGRRSLSARLDAAGAHK